MAEKSKSEDFVRYVIKPRSDIIVGGVHAYYDLGLAESEAKYWAKETCHICNPFVLSFVL